VTERDVPNDVGLDSSGEAERLSLRRPFRWDRAGLLYAGRRYACWTVTLTPGEFAALQQGREILITPGTEYLLLLKLRVSTKENRDGV
jgi:hypothetical protein